MAKKKEKIRSPYMVREEKIAEEFKRLILTTNQNMILDMYFGKDILKEEVGDEKIIRNFIKKFAKSNKLGIDFCD